MMAFLLNAFRLGTCLEFLNEILTYFEAMWWIYIAAAIEYWLLRLCGLSFYSVVVKS